MKRKLLAYLRCPSCEGILRLGSVDQEENTEILEGRLDCESCARTFSILRGIPRFASQDELDLGKAETAETLAGNGNTSPRRKRPMPINFWVGLRRLLLSFFAARLFWKVAVGKDVTPL